MKELVYKFLDDYLGDEIYCDRESELFTHTIYSCKNDCLMVQVAHYVTEGKIICIEGESLIHTIFSFFDIESLDSREYFFEWFENKFNVKLRGNHKEAVKFLDGIREPQRPNSLRSVESPAPF